MCARDCKILCGLVYGGTKVDFAALNAGVLRAAEAARRLTAGRGRARRYRGGVYEIKIKMRLLT